MDTPATHEAARLGALRSYAVLDTAAEPEFDHVTRLAARLLGVPIALISLIDEGPPHRRTAAGMGDITMSEDDVATKLAVHEAVCAERWKQANERLGRIEIVLAAIVLLLLVGEGSVVAVLRRLIGG